MTLSQISVQRIWWACAAFAWVAIAGCVQPPPPAPPVPPFSIAVIPDTQNYVDYTHQKNTGFALDASELFIQQLGWIAARSRARGGNIAFVASVGDVWQHPSKVMDADHAERGIDRVANPFFDSHFQATAEELQIEIDKAIEGYRLISAAGLPFGVAPGNHDYDAMWGVAAFPPNLDKPEDERGWDDLGVMHVGGLDNFRSAFGDHTDFFKGRDWYVGSFRGGANSAQVFRAGGYRFLHLALEMQPDDEVLAWAESVLARFPDHPTIVSTHDYLNVKGERAAVRLIDLDLADPDHHNSAEELYTKLIAPNDQIFLVLCGHQHGQSLRVDRNAAGHEVYQMLADYQDRGQAGVEAGQPLDEFVNGPAGLGDGWFRLLEFDLAAEVPKLHVRTYSTHYKMLSSELDTYAQWYREHEQPEMTDAEFLAADEYTIPLVDFQERFGAP